MMRLAGALLVLLCGWGAGASAAAGRRLWLRRVAAVEDYLSCLEADLQYTRAPLWQIAARLAARGEFAALPLAQVCGRAAPDRPFSAEFRSAVCQQRKELGQQCCDALEGLAGQLGTLPANPQLEALELCRRRLEEIRCRQEPIIAQQCRLWHSLGILGAAAAVVLLW